MTRPKHETAANALRLIPAKWAVAVVAILIGYVLLQPRLNQWFGWSLPSLASLVGDEKPAAKKETVSKTVAPEITKDFSEPASKTREKVSNDADDDYPLYGFLSEVGRNRYESPAGLIYGSGSEEGHRLKHIARHLEDQPDRPGSHGVFQGTMKEFLVAIDDGFTRAKKGGKGTKKEENGDSTVYEATFDKTIGFQGGQSGGRKKKPPSKKIRIVVRGESLITAFPF